jgi:anti-anti-sigma factor
VSAEPAVRHARSIESAYLQGLRGPRSEALDVLLEHRSDTVVVRVRGELDSLGAPSLRLALRRLGTGPRRVIIDLAAVSFLDSAGLRVLLGAHRRAQVNAREFVLAGATRDVLGVFRTAGLDVVVPFAPDVASVLERSA